MPLVVYMDEAGTPHLDTIDPQYPVFGVVLFICDAEKYVSKVVPAIYRFKINHLGHEATILHSYDIRKSKNDFKFLADPTKRTAFMTDISHLMSTLDYSLIAAIIHKERHKARYGNNAVDPYDLAFTFTLERLLPLLERAGQNDVTIMAEARGKKENAQIERSFLHFVNEGNDYIPASRLRKIQFRMRFYRKECNMIGMQIADLAAFPIARYALDPTAPNNPFDLLRPKIYKGPGLVKGLKVFP